MESTVILLIVFTFVALYVFTGFRLVRQNTAQIIERLGRYHRTLEAGIHILIPLIDRPVAYKTGNFLAQNFISLKEMTFDIEKQQAITKDNVGLTIDGVLYYKIVDPKLATYGIDNLNFAIEQLAQTIMRAQIGRLALDETFESRETLNAKITAAIDEAAGAWGTKITRYEIKDINPPDSIREEMEKQMAAERERRAEVTRSEGYRQSQINQAEGDQQAMILRAKGRADAIVVEATARAESIRTLGKSIEEKGGVSAVSQLLAEKYVQAFNDLARKGTVALIPSDGSDIASMVVKGFSAFQSAQKAIDLQRAEENQE